MKRFAVCLIVVVFALSAGRAGAATFQGLGYLTEWEPRSTGYGLSADGSVAVGYSYSASSLEEAFRWTATGGMIGLGSLPGTSRSEAYGVSDDGSMVVGTAYDVVEGDHEAFRWRAGVGMVGLGDLPGGSSRSIASDLSDDGSIVVGYGTSASGQEAFRWSQGGSMVGLGVLPGGTWSSAAGVSADGSVVVGYGDSGFDELAFRWTQAGGIVALGDLPGGLTISRAFDVSADGSVVVGAGLTASGREAFRWTAGEGMVGLGTLVGGSADAGATGVSADGSVVVGYEHVGGGYEAFVWDATGGIRNLMDVLAGDLGLDLSGWDLERAYDISAQGNVILGYGTNPFGYGEAWVAVLYSSELHWIHGSGGEWDVAKNWDLADTPGARTATFIDPQVGLTVTGPADTTTVKSLTVGAQTSGTATLALQDTGTLTVTEGTTITPRGKLTGTGTLNAIGGVTNNGEIDLGTGSLQLVGGTLTNSGLIHGNGRIENRLDNLGGEVRGQPGRHLLFTGSGNTNYGLIDLAGGLIEFAQDLTNVADQYDTGFISGRGQLRVHGGLTNNGIMALSGGFTDIYGDVVNTEDGRIVISGGSTTTFYDDVHSDGELRISTGSSAVFFGEFSGTGGTTGPGTAYMEGDLRPGNSPAEISFGGDLVFGSTAGLEIELADPDDGPANDRLDVVGDVYLDGALTVEALSNLGTVGDILRTIITAAGPGGVSGIFSDGPGVGDHLGYGVFHQGVSYETGAVDLSVLQALAGDTDGNRDVSFADFNNLANNYTGAGGSGKDWTQGDFDGDGDVDFADFNNLANNYTGTGVEYAAGKAAIVPEPGTLVLLVCGAFGLLLALRRRRRSEYHR